MKVKIGSSGYDKIQGIVIASDWYISGEPSEISISCKAEKDYVIRAGSSSEALFSLIGRLVEVKGHIHWDDKKSTLLIDVFDYRLVQRAPHNLDYEE